MSAITRNPDVRALLTIALRAQGYDGLFSTVGDCACKLGDLAPCDSEIATCEAGFEQPCGEDCGEHTFHIGRVPRTTS